MAIIKEAALRSYSLKNGLILVAVVLAYGLGFGLAVHSTLGTLIIQLLAVLALVLATILAPVEWLILAAIFAVMAADSWLVPYRELYYIRFIPMGMLTVRALLELWRRRREQVSLPGTFLIPALVFLAFCFFSLIYSIDRSLTLQRTLSMAFIVLGFGIALPLYMGEDPTLERRLKLILAVMTIVVVVGTVVFGSSGKELFQEGDVTRFTGIFANPNTQGLIGMVIFFPLMWWWRSARHVWGKLILGGLVLVAAGLIVASGSRAAIYGSLCGLAFFYWLQGRSAWSQFLLFGLGLILVFAIVLPGSDLMVRILDPSDPSRLFLWDRTLMMASRSPIWGIGFGASDSLYAADANYLLSIGIIVSGSHNSFLRNFLEVGAIGTVLGLAVFGVGLARVLTGPASIRQDPLAAALAGAVVAGLIDAIFEDWLFSFGSSSTVPMWLFAALLALRIQMLVSNRTNAARVLEDQVDHATPLGVTA